MKIEKNDKHARLIIACELVEAKFTTLAAMWQSVDMPRTELSNFYDTSFRPTITKSVSLVLDQLEEKPSIIECILNELLKFDEKLKRCANGDLGKVVMCGLISGMVLTQLLMGGESCIFIPESRHVNGQFFVDGLHKSGWSYVHDESRLNRISCQDVAKKLLMVLEST